VFATYGAQSHMADDSSNPILLYDGVCGLCDRVVQFVLKRDTRGKFRFAALQSEFAARVLRRHDVKQEELDTVYMVLDFGLPGERLTARSDAAICILRELGGFWGVMAGLMRMVPRALRDWGYNRVARNRYRVFGEYETCMLPEERYRERFLDGHK
jgi:predicted DCC family thiol-disulfide oxidoreductase YuxK